MTLFETGVKGFLSEVVVRFGLRVGPVKREIPSASSGQALRYAGKNGYAQDDKVV